MLVAARRGECVQQPRAKRPPTIRDDRDGFDRNEDEREPGPVAEPRRAAVPPSQRSRFAFHRSATISRSAGWGLTGARLTLRRRRLYRSAAAPRFASRRDLREHARAAQVAGVGRVLRGLREL